MQEGEIVISLHKDLATDVFVGAQLIGLQDRGMHLRLDRIRLKLKVHSTNGQQVVDKLFGSFSDGVEGYWRDKDFVLHQLCVPLNAGVYTLSAQLMYAHALDADALFEWLEPLGPEIMRRIIIRDCEFRWAGDGLEEAYVGRTTTFTISTSCSDLAHRMSFTVRFGGPSIFVANVTTEAEPGQFQVRYTPMESGTHELSIMFSYHHHSESNAAYKHAAYSGSMLAPSLLNDTVPVVEFLDSESSQPMRWCNSTETGGKQP